MAWLGINGSFRDPPAVAARRTDLVLHSGMAVAILLVSPALNEHGRFGALLLFFATLLEFSVFCQFMCLAFLPHSLSLRHFLTPQISIFTIPSHPVFSLLGDVPAGVPPSAPQHSHVNERVTAFLFMLKEARCLVHHMLESLCLLLKGEKEKERERGGERQINVS